MNTELITLNNESQQRILFLKIITGTELYSVDYN